MIRRSSLALSLVAVAMALAPVGCHRSGENVAKLPDQPTQPSATTASTTATSADAGAGAAVAAAPSIPDAGASASGTPFLSATTEAHRRSTLTPKVSSPILRVAVREGDVVRAGQPLVVLDTEDFRLRTKQAEAALQQARVGQDAAKLDYDRMKALVAEKAIPQSQFDMVDAKYKGAQAGVAQAETAVAMGRKALRDSVVTAPFRGLVVKRYVNEGEYAAVMPPTALVTLEELDPIDLRISVPSADLNKIHAGDPIRVRLPALGRELEARVTRVVQANDPKTRSFSAIAEIPNSDHSLRSGLYAEVTPASAGNKVADGGVSTTAKRGKTVKQTRKAQ